MEAHGGYSFCGLAALMLMGKGHLCDTESLLRWAANRQMRLEGGFQVKRPPTSKWSQSPKLFFLFQGSNQQISRWVLLVLARRNFSLTPPSFRS